MAVLLASRFYGSRQLEMMVTVNVNVETAKKSEHFMTSTLTVYCSAAVLGFGQVPVSRAYWGGFSL
jgi:hypothetical protein